MTIAVSSLCGAVAYFVLSLVQVIQSHRPSATETPSFDLAQALRSDETDPGSLKSVLARIVQRAPAAQPGEPAPRPARELFDADAFREKLGDIDLNDVRLIREKLGELDAVGDSRARFAAQGEIVDLMVARPIQDAEVIGEIRSLLDEEVQDAQGGSEESEAYLIRLQRAFLVTEPTAEEALEITEKAALRAAEAPSALSLYRQFRFHFPDKAHLLEPALQRRGLSGNEISL
jgi:hypothetical protein